MRPIKVALVSIGGLKHRVDIPYLENWRSEILKIDHKSSIPLLPDASGPDWPYMKSQLCALMRPDSQSDFTVGLINAPLEDNYYMRRLDDKLAILSLFEMAEIARLFNFTLENFILRNLYELAVLHAASGGVFASDAESWAHHDIRGCLFDLNANKSDIVFSMHKPTLCHTCHERVLKNQIDPKFISTLNKELSRIRKTLYVRIAEWVEAHPLRALAMTGAFAILLNLIANFLFEKLKPLFL